MAGEQQPVIDLSDIVDTSHENKWVAIARDYSSVIDSADRLRDLVRSIPDKDAISGGCSRTT